jgi:hypothetical protein
MNRRPWERARGIKQITRGLGTLDRELFMAIAESPTPLLDTVLPPLTRAADHSKLWLVIAAGLLASRKSGAQSCRCFARCPCARPSADLEFEEGHARFIGAVFYFGDQ